MVVLPSIVKIGVRDIKIIREDLSADSLLGIYLPDQMLIKIDTNITDPALLLETFWHELIHAIHDYIRFVWELDQEMNSVDGETGGNPWAFEENITYNFALTLLQVLDDNQMIPTRT